MNTKSLLLNKIISGLEENNIQNFTLNNVITSTEELFFERKNIVLSRNLETEKCEVTIYNDFEVNGEFMRGSSSFIATPAMSVEDISKKICSAFETALSVHNPYYKLPASNSMFSYNDSNEIINRTDENIYTAYDFAEMIYKYDNIEDSFINSSEIFVTKKFYNIINSNGINVSYSDTTYFCEYIVQCKKTSDVELYQDMKFSSLDKDIDVSIKDTIIKSLTMVKDRSNAVPVNSLESEPVFENIILEGNCVYDLFNYYVKRLDASMIYPGYSSYKINDNVASSNTLEKTASDSINITLTPKKPYSEEGIKLLSTTLIKDNIVKCITGNSRFSHYLSLPPVGEYSSYKLACGNTSLDEILKEPHLRIVNFSDFQMDNFTGQFGGEYRLAYYFDGKTTIPLTNGSISGNITDLVKTMRLSKEKQNFYDFEGPLMVCYKNT